MIRFLHRMKKIAIAVWGTAGIGKTSTIRRVFDRLNVEGKVPDICVIINLNNGKEIGIESLGDPDSDQLEIILLPVRPRKNYGLHWHSTNFLLSE